MAITHLPLSLFIPLGFESRVALFINHLADQLSRVDFAARTSQLIGESTQSSQYNFSLFELDIRFACEERIGAPMTAEMYQQIVLPLLSMFFVEHGPTMRFVTSLTDRAITLFNANAACEPKAPCCTIVIRPV